MPGGEKSPICQPEICQLQASLAHITPIFNSVWITHHGNDSANGRRRHVLSFGLAHQGHSEVFDIEHHPLQQGLLGVCPVLRQLWWDKSTAEKSANTYTVNNKNKVKTRENWQRSSTPRCLTTATAAKLPTFTNVSGVRATFVPSDLWQIIFYHLWGMQAASISCCNYADKNTFTPADKLTGSNPAATVSGSRLL